MVADHSGYYPVVAACQRNGPEKVMSGCMDDEVGQEIDGALESLVKMGLAEEIISANGSVCYRITDLGQAFFYRNIGKLQ
jgi:hypothetical protein